MRVYCGGLKPVVLEPDTERQLYTANVNRQTADKLLFSYAIITDEYM